MKITILHNAVADSDSQAERDVLTQVATVETALQSLGHETSYLPCTLNLEVVAEALRANRPQIVFNLVESLGRSDRLAHLAAVLLEDLDLPYTGTQAAQLHRTNNKPRTKERLRAAGLPTPDWTPAASANGKLSPPYIIKSIWEHASLGLDDHSVIVEGDGETVGDQIESRSRHLGQPCFAEQFIDGREFNLSLIAMPDGPCVLPPAEIDFSTFPVGRPRIVGYAAKWDEEAVEFQTTPRTFDFTVADQPLLDRLRAMAFELWQLFGLRGYARVDIRIDDLGQPWILEINANPCLSPDAGFAAALAKADIPFGQAIEWIVADALRPALQETVIAAVENQPTIQEPVLSTQYSVPSTLHSAASVAQKTSGMSPTRPTKLGSAKNAKLKLRTKPKRTDAAAVRALVAGTGLFRDAEVDVAEELVQTRLKKGTASGYDFIFVEENKAFLGYVCFGRNALTLSSFDVYWIAVQPSQQGRGIGKLLLAEAEKQIAAAGGSRIYIETSHRADYQATRGFYERCGYSLVAVLDDFYAPGDGKATYVKVLDPISADPAEAVALSAS